MAGVDTTALMALVNVMAELKGIMQRQLEETQGMRDDLAELTGKRAHDDDDQDDDEDGDDDARPGTAPAASNDPGELIPAVFRSLMHPASILNSLAGKTAGTPPTSPREG